MVILQVTFVLLMHTVELRAYPTMAECLTVKTLLEQGEPPVKGLVQRFECRKKEEL